MSMADALRRIALKTRITADDLRGLDFYRTVLPDDAGPDWTDVKRSSASAPRAVRRAMTQVGTSTEDGILDIGCGKGAALRAMLGLPSRRLAGIELSPAVSTIARRNFAAIGRPDVEIITADALRYDGYGGFSVLYAYNPVPVDRVPALAEALRASIRADQPLTLVYANPMGHDAIVASGLFCRWRALPGFAGNTVHVYVNGSAAQRLSGP